MTTPRPELDALVERARRLSAHHADDFAVYWAVVGKLHEFPEEPVFEAARAYAQSAEPLDRMLAADLLGQLGWPDLPFRTKTVSIILDLLGDDDFDVLESAIFAAGHLGVSAYLGSLAPFAAHQTPDLRLALAIALGSASEPGALELLLGLSADTDPEVRNWATFGIGSLSESDSAVVRQALLERLLDPHDETRGEALLGLARRGDPRVLEPLRRELESDQVEILAVEAAAVLADPRLHPVLQKLSLRWDPCPDYLEEALVACSRK